ncbi:response regulator [Methyloglobulus sp.]|uniref:hybrid sensor histidine kinase/response regulator n=1 Tax=Methyloglobulus sp. TaxID=2518622 RepID=UPI0032B7A56D
MKNIFQITPRNGVDDFVAVIEELADQSAQAGYYGLQDANLVLAEAIRELQLDEGFQSDADLSALVAAWGQLIEKFSDAPDQTAKAMISYLRHPCLKIPMADDEFNMLEQQLFSDANAAVDANESLGELETNAADKASDLSEQCLINEQIIIIEQLADQTAYEGLYGLQDANLLLAEALREMVNEGPANVDADFIKALSGWAGLIGSYREEPKRGAEAIINLLRHPVLKISMGDDEFAMLREQLATEVSVNEFAQEVSGSDDPAELETFAVHHGNPKDGEHTGSVSRVAQELVDLLLLEAEQVRFYLQGISIGDNESMLNGLQDAGEELERFANMAKTVGFEGLAQVSTHIILNIQRFIEDIDDFTSERYDLLLEWISQVQEYLPSFHESNAGQLIVAGLTDEQWALSMSFEELAAILLQIRTESTEVGNQTETARVETATDEDISLALPDDVNHELLDLLLQELPVHTRQFSEAVQRMQSGGSEQDVEVAQRAAHTLKGSANTVGIKGIAVLTHHLEDILIACASEQKLPGRGLANSLINASDCLESMSEALLSSGSSPHDAKAVLQEILDWANRIDKEGIPDSEVDENLAETQISSGNTTEAVEKLAPEQSQATFVRVAAEQVETLFRISGESIILNSQAHESIRRMKKQMQTMQIQFALLQQLGAELEQLIDLKDLTGRSFGAVGTGFDALEMDQYNELHTASRRMAEAAIDAKEISQDVGKELDKMYEVLDDQQRLVINVQEVVMQTRLVSIATIAPRLQRSLRQTCRMTEKQSELVLVGENILIDGDTLNAMVDPLMHILRNAVDHGIESTDERLAQGKLSSGRISFEFDREGNNILVRCRDDGRGLDYGAIRAAAEKRGLLKPDEDMSEEELRRFILRPNFSSRTVSTQTSGRGVGLDAVRAQIVNMGGTLTLDSVQGQGMTIELRVPLPLSMTYALLTHVGRYRVAIANKGIAQIVYSAAGEVVIEGDKEFLLLDGVTYPATRLMDLLHVPDHRKSQRTYGAILLVQNDDKTTAVLIDAINDSMDVVIKSMGHYIGKIPGYIGATILGDGTVTPVLDIPELLRVPIRAVKGVYAEPIDMDEPDSMLPTALVVDDSLSQRRALEQLLSDAGYRVRTARDGIEAAEILVQFQPDVILTDLEMPRMNGIELAAHIRTQEKIRSLPVIMITSRTTQKHRQMAEEAGVNAYFSKPVRDEDLLVKMQILMELAAEKKGKRLIG